MPIVVAFVHVVGAIGAGKSSMLERAVRRPTEFLAALGRLPEFAWLAAWPPLGAGTELAVALEEPARWVAADGQSLLDCMYAEPTRYAAEFQTAVLRDRLRAAAAALCDALRRATVDTSHVLVVTDGSVDVDHSVFARGCYEAGVMTTDEWVAYDEVYGRVERVWAANLAQMGVAVAVPLAASVRGTLYLATPLDETRKRIELRGRACERRLEPAYLGGVIERLEYLLASAAYPATPVARVRDTPPDAAEPFEPIEAVV